MMRRIGDLIFLDYDSDRSYGGDPWVKHEVRVVFLRRYVVSLAFSRSLRKPGKE